MSDNLRRFAAVRSCLIKEYPGTPSKRRTQHLSTLTALERFFSGVLAHLDPDRHLLLITSDHGNLEDLSTKSHTRHAVPLVAYRRGATHFAEVNQLTGVTPAVLAALSAQA